jgi:hypothetical protein
MTPNTEGFRGKNNPFEELWQAMKSSDGPAARRAGNRIEREFRSIERRLAKRVVE